MTNTPRLATSTPRYAGDMERSPSEAAVDLTGAGPDRADLHVLIADAEQIASTFTDGWADHFLHPTVTVEADPGFDGGELFIFTIGVDLAEGYDPADYPRDGIEELKADLRARLFTSLVGPTNSIVTVMTQAAVDRR